MPNGYMGKVLWIDLLERRCQQEPLEAEICRSLIGGYGLGAGFLYPRIKKGVDPLSPDNILGFVTGPFTGTRVLGGSRYVVVGKSPLTGGWGDANSGGYFGPHLKFAGYDAVFITGVSDSPVYLLIDDQKVEIRDASHLWGKDCYDTERQLKLLFGRKSRVACIGPAGEKMALAAAIMNDGGRAAGRSGLGAVMGSKKLKAVVVRGGIRVPVADPERVDLLRKEYIGRLGGTIAWLKEYGTSFVTSVSAHSGDSPVKNWSGVGTLDFPNIEPFFPQNLVTRRSKKFGCYLCPISCGALMKRGSGEYEYEEGSHRPEYETLAMFGPNCLNDNLDSILKMNDLCNRYGVDTIEVGATLAFVMECFEKGLISVKDIDGLEMTWGNHRSMVAMLEKLVKREGFGDVIADGVRLAGERISGGAQQFAMHVHGQAVPAHDPKHDFRWGIAYLSDPTPARHTQNPEIFIPQAEVVRVERKEFGKEAGKYRRDAALHHVMNCTGMCAFVYSCLPDVKAFVQFLNAVTGWNETVESLLPTGERILNLRQAFNIREGLTLEDFKMPERILGNPPFERGPLAKVRLDQGELLSDYLRELDWNVLTGVPSLYKLRQLGLTHVINDLHGGSADG